MTKLSALKYVTAFGLALCFAPPAGATTFKAKLAKLRTKTFAGKTTRLPCVTGVPHSNRPLHSSPRIKLRLTQDAQGKLSMSGVIENIGSAGKQVHGTKRPGPFFEARVVRPVSLDNITVNAKDGTFRALRREYSYLPTMVGARNASDFRKVLRQSVELHGQMQVVSSGLEATIERVHFQKGDNGKYAHGPSTVVTTYNTKAASFSMK